MEGERGADRSHRDPHRQQKRKRPPVGDEGIFGEVEQEGERCRDGQRQAAVLLNLGEDGGTELALDAPVPELTGNGMETVHGRTGSP